MPNAGAIEVAAVAAVAAATVTVTVVVVGIPKAIVPAEVLLAVTPKLVAGILVTVASPNIGLVREFWKGDTALLLTAVTAGLVVAPVDIFENPLGTGALDVDVNPPKVGVIDGKATALKAVDAGSVVGASATIAAFFIMF